MGLSTKDVQTGGGGTPKVIQPGNISAKITGISLDQPPYMQAENGYFLVLHVEGPDMGSDFEGFLVDKDNPELGRHAGQVGRIKASRWAYKDGTTKSGIPVNRDQSILKFVKNLCEALGIVKWFDKADNKHETIEEFIQAFNDEAPWKDKYINYCVCARTYEKENGYIGYDLYLPKFSRDGIPFEAEDASPSKLLKFDETKHVEASKPKSVTEFGSDDLEPAATNSAPSTDFEL